MLLFANKFLKNIFVNRFNHLFATIKKPAPSIPSFKNYQFIEPLEKYLEQKEYHTPSSVQTKYFRQTMLHKDNHNFYLIGPTGSGKTLAYLLPIIQELKKQQLVAGSILTKPNRPRCLIVVSSKELVSQLKQICKEISHFCKFKVDGLGIHPDKSREIKLLEDGVDMLVTTPERLSIMREHVHLGYITHLVIDEFDTLLDANFGEKLEIIIQAMKIRQIKSLDTNQPIPKILFVSATYTKMMEEFFTKTFSYYERDLKFYKQTELNRLKGTELKIAKQFQLKKIVDTNTHLNLQNIKHEFVHCSSIDKHQPLYSLLKQQKNKLLNSSVMIFCNTVKSLHELQYYLNQNGIKVTSLHGTLPKVQRFDNFNQFKNRNINILLTTDLGSRGLDLQFVTHVINYDFPKTISDYLHRAGRTGRAGKKGFVFTLYHNKNLDLINELKSSYDTNKPLDIKNSAYSLKNKEELQKKYNRRKRGRAIKKGK